MEGVTCRHLSIHLLKKWKQPLSGWGDPKIPGSKAGAGDNGVARILLQFTWIQRELLLFPW